MTVRSYKEQVGGVLRPHSSSAKINQVVCAVSLGVFANYPSPGSGYLAGEYPGGTTTVDGVPQSAEIRVLWRDPNNSYMDGVVVARTVSAADGTWRVLGLNPNLRYDVVGRKDGHNDVIAANVQPVRTDVITVSGSFVPNEDYDGVDGSMTVFGGLPPYQLSVIEPLPPGLTATLDGHSLKILGRSTAPGVWESVLKVVASNGVVSLISVQIETRSIPLQFSETNRTTKAGYEDSNTTLFSISGAGARAASDVQKSDGKLYLEFYSTAPDWISTNYEFVGLTTEDQIMSESFNLSGSADLRVIFRRYGGSSNGAQVMKNGETIWINGPYRANDGFVGIAIDLDVTPARFWVNLNGSWVDNANPKDSPLGWRTFVRSKPLIPAAGMDVALSQDARAKVRIVGQKTEFQAVTPEAFDVGGALEGFVPWKP